METREPKSGKITARATLLVLLIISIPAFFWFRYLYDQYVVERISPEMAKMRDSMMHPKPGGRAAPLANPKKNGPTARKEQSDANN